MMRKSVLLLAILLCIVVSTGVQASSHLETYFGPTINIFSPRTETFAPIAPGLSGGVKLWFDNRIGFGLECEYLNTASEVFGVKNVLEETGYFATLSVRVYRGLQVYFGPGYYSFKATSDVYGEKDTLSNSHPGFKSGLEYSHNLAGRLNLKVRAGFRLADAFMNDIHPGFTGLETGVAASFSF